MVCGSLCCCCGKKKANTALIPEGGIDAERSCTDCPFIIIYAIFCIGWIVVASVAFANGDPWRIVRPSDYDSNVCGEPGALPFDRDGNTYEITPTLEERPYLFIPNPANYRFGICVEACPAVGDSVCMYDVETDPAWKRKGTYLASGQCYIAAYETNSTLWRCIPASLAAINGNTTKAVELVKSLTVGKYLSQGFGEVYDARWVIFLTGWTALIVTLLWIFLMRFLIKPIVYFTIVAVFFMLFGLGWLAYRQIAPLERLQASTADEETAKQIRTYRAFAYIFWIASGIYLMLLAWLLSRIRIAIEVIRESSKALLQAKSLVFIPPITFALMMIVGIWWVTVAAYIHSAGKIETIPWANSTNPVDSAYARLEGVDFVSHGINASAINATESVNGRATKFFTSDYAFYYMQVYNLFGFFWTINFFLSIGFFTICSTVVVWFFSEPTDSDKDKHVGPLAVAGSFKRALRYHLGSLLFGSALIALVQTIRFVLNYAAKKLDVMKNSQTAKIALAVMNCCLCCLEKLINFINKNAYIVIAVKGVNFCRAAGLAMALLLKNVVRVATTSFISTFVLFLIKVLIMVTNLMIGFGLLKSSMPTEPIKSGILPAMVIAVITFAIATMFMNIYDNCVDTVLMCFFMDDEQDNREKYYMPKSLAKLVDKYTKIEEMRKEADRMMAMAEDDVENTTLKPQKSMITKKQRVAPELNTAPMTAGVTEVEPCQPA